MNIAITGATGYIGKHLSAYFAEVGGHRVFPLGRKMFHDDAREELAQTLSQCDVVINLAGAPIIKRWTSNYKKELYDSRIHVTRCIVNALAAAKPKPKLLISTSAVGYYPATDGAMSISDKSTYDEYSPMRGEGFLAELCYAWEQEARRSLSTTRIVITRFGIVLSPDGGAMRQMLTPLRIAKIATVIGPGTQPFPWISIHDLCRAMAFVIGNNSLEGAFNLVAPEEISQKAFTRMVAKAYHAWLTLLVPRAMFRLLYGEAASFLITGQYVRPTRLLEAGFIFSVPAVKKLLERTKGFSHI